MAKGKKFTAAEKHFEKKCVEWRQRLRELEYNNNELRKENYLLRKANEEMIMEIDRVLKETAAIAELKNLSEEDVKLLLETARCKQKLSAMIDVMAPLTKTFQ